MTNVSLNVSFGQAVSWRVVIALGLPFLFIPINTLCYAGIPQEKYNEVSGFSALMRAESLGLHAAYTYDHLSWRSFRDRPWFEAMTTLAAAAVATSTLRLGTLVTSPNFRHPVPLAKELLTLDDLSEGRLVVGIGSGGTGGAGRLRLGGSSPGPSENRPITVSVLPVVNA